MMGDERREFVLAKLQNYRFGILNWWAGQPTEMTQ